MTDAGDEDGDLEEPAISTNRIYDGENHSDSPAMILKLDDDDRDNRDRYEDDNIITSGAIQTIQRQVSITGSDSPGLSSEDTLHLLNDIDTELAADPGADADADLELLTDDLSSVKLDDAELYIQSDEWKNKEKHIFILSKSGKPIYTRYGNEEKLVTDMGVMTAMVSFVENSDDQLRYIIAGEHKIVFLIREHLILVCVSYGQESPPHLNQVLTYIYNQILSILTHSVLSKMFEKRRNYDLRLMLAGAERLIDSLIDFVESDMCALLGAVQCLPLATATRDQVASCVANGAKTKDLVFALLLTSDQLVTLVHMRKHYLHPVDLHLLLNLVQSSESFRQAEQWCPVCLPKFDASGYLYAHVSYLDAKTCLMLLTVDKTQFTTLSEFRARILDKLTKLSLLEALENAARYSYYTVNDTGVSELRHFVYKWRNTAQCTAPRYGPPYTTRDEQRRLLGHLYRVHHLLHGTRRPLKLLYQCSQTETFLGWVTSNFELYSVFSPLVTKPAAIRAVNKLLKWIKREEDRIFILTSPTF